MMCRQARAKSFSYLDNEVDLLKAEAPALKVLSAVRHVGPVNNEIVCRQLLDPTMRVRKVKAAAQMRTNLASKPPSQ